MEEGLMTAFETAITTVKTDVSGMYSKALPIALGLMVIPFGIRLGINFFRSLAS